MSRTSINFGRSKKQHRHNKFHTPSWGFEHSVQFLQRLQSLTKLCLTISYSKGQIFLTTQFLLCCNLEKAGICSYCRYQEYAPSGWSALKDTGILHFVWIAKPQDDINSCVMVVHVFCKINFHFKSNLALTKTSPKHQPDVKQTIKRNFYRVKFLISLSIVD